MKRKFSAVFLLCLFCLFMAGCFYTVDEDQVNVTTLELTGVGNDALLSSASSVSFHCYVNYGGVVVDISRGLTWDADGGGKYTASVIDSPIYNDLPHMYVFTFREDNDGDGSPDDKFMLNVTSGVTDGEYMSMTPATTFAAMGAAGITSFSGSGISGIVNSVINRVGESDYSTSVDDASVAEAKSTVAARLGLGSLDDPVQAADVKSTAGQNYLTPAAMAGSGVAQTLASLASSAATDLSSLTLKDSNGAIRTPDQSAVNVYLTALVSSVNSTAVTMGTPDDFALSLDGSPEFSLPQGRTDTTPVYSAEISFAATRDVTTTVCFQFEGRNQKAVLELSSLKWDASAASFVLPEDAAVTIKQYPKKLMDSYSIIASQANNVENTFQAAGSVLTVNLTSVVSGLMWDTIGTRLGSGSSFSFSIEFGSLLLSTDGTASRGFNKITGTISSR